jgi:hypothetical protein
VRMIPEFLSEVFRYETLLVLLMTYRYLAPHVMCTARNTLSVVSTKSLYTLKGSEILSSIFNIQFIPNHAPPEQ